MGTPAPYVLTAEPLAQSFEPGGEPTVAAPSRQARSNMPEHQRQHDGDQGQCHGWILAPNESSVSDEPANRRSASARSTFAAN